MGGYESACTSVCEYECTCEREFTCEREKRHKREREGEIWNNGRNGDFRNVLKTYNSAFP